jgi:hypothetical protein
VGTHIFSIASGLSYAYPISEVSELFLPCQREPVGFPRPSSINNYWVTFLKTRYSFADLFYCPCIFMTECVRESTK